MRRVIICLLLFNLSCSYHYLDNSVNFLRIFKRNDTVQIELNNNTKRFNIDEIFKNVLENRILMSPLGLKLVSCNACWVVKITIEDYQLYAIDLVTSKNKNLKVPIGPGSANGFNLSVVISTSVINSMTGDTVLVHPHRTFTYQYPLEVNYVGSYHQELNMLDSVLETVANDFAENFLVQFVEGYQ